MKVAKLLHNPKAGNEGHDKEALSSIIKAAGFECRYSSASHLSEEVFEDDIDFIIVAGGDGTVRKLIEALLRHQLPLEKFPIAILPLGTANNISKTLNIEGEVEDIVQSWTNWHLKNFDLGKFTHNSHPGFFLESFGFGLFPSLMEEMEKIEGISDALPQEQLNTALKLLQEITHTYTPKECRMTIDDTDYTNEYLLVEVMNTRSIGPNLFLSPDSDPFDGQLDVVLLPHEDKEKFDNYVSSKLTGNPGNYLFQTIKANRINLAWNGVHVHADDESLSVKQNQEITIQLQKGAIKFLVP